MLLSLFASLNVYIENRFLSQLFAALGAGIIAGIAHNIDSIIFSINIFTRNYISKYCPLIMNKF